MKERDLIIQWLSWKRDRDGRAFSQKKLAVGAGISPTYLSNIITGTRNPGTKTLERIAGAFGISMAEFYAGPPQSSFSSSPATDVSGGDALEESDIRGQVKKEPEDDEITEISAFEDTEIEGEPEKTGLALSDTSPDQLEKLFDTVGVSLADLFSLPSEAVPEKKAAPHGKTLKKVSRRKKKSPDDSEESDQIPLLSRVPPGEYRKWFESGKTKKFSTFISRCSVQGSHVFAIQIDDTCMVPDLHKGDVLIINPDDKFTAVDGGIGVVVLNRRFMARKIYLHGGEYLLIPSNSAYKMDTAPIEGTQIFKVALWIPASRGKF